MRKQGVAAVENMGNGIDLMRPQRDLRIDSHEIQVAAVILTGANAVELLVIQLGQLLPAFRVAPNPISKGLLTSFFLRKVKKAAAPAPIAEIPASAAQRGILVVSPVLGISVTGLSLLWNLATTVFPS